MRNPTRATGAKREARARSLARNCIPNGSIAFLDTNVLLYAASGRPAGILKTDCARRLIKAVSVCVSFQVLQEFYANAVNPKKLNLTPSEAAERLATWIQFPVATLGADTFVTTLELAHKFRISRWDAAILAAAAQMGCHTVYSEDLSHGQDYDGVTVESPFRDIPQVC
ncbi:MAG: PIN domain-containing protein [Planctomycetes bacterium]|nr:PIN domain-containing protein [Planctomycetota bacterium]